MFVHAFPGFQGSGVPRVPFHVSKVPVHGFKIPVAPKI